MEKKVSKSILLSVYIMVFVVCIHFLKLKGELILWTQLIAYITLGSLALASYREDFISGFKECKSHPLKNGLWFIGAFIADLILNNLALFPQALLYPDYTSSQEHSISEVFTTSSVPAIILILALGVFGPVLEEAVYRLFLIGDCSQKISSWITVPVAAILFMAIHMHSLTLPELLSHLPKLVTGLIYGITLKATKNPVIPAGLHVLNNLPALIIVALGVM